MIPGWKEEIEGEYMAFLRECRKATPADVAARVGVSECCAIYWLTNLAREGCVRILAVELVEDGQVSRDREVPVASPLQPCSSAPDAGRVLEAAA